MDEADEERTTSSLSRCHHLPRVPIGRVSPCDALRREKEVDQPTPPVSARRNGQESSRQTLTARRKLQTIPTSPTFVLLLSGEPFPELNSVGLRRSSRELSFFLPLPLTAKSVVLQSLFFAVA